MKNKELAVAALKNGTVIDHIPSKALFKVVDLLEISKMETNVTIGFNLDSKRLGKKGIIKVADVFFPDATLNRIALIAPNAKINIIQDYEVVAKNTVTLANEVRGLVKCCNPNCVTNNEPMPTHFSVIDREAGVLKCVYCEHPVEKDDIELI